jgi:ribosome-binding ATPase
MLIGIVGKPSCGKSTFFKAATLADAEIANYPFTTIKPNRAMAYVKVECVDKEFGVQCNPRVGYCVSGTRFVPVELLDVAGLVPDAHKGHGKGNEFLDDLRQADVLIHVIDISGSVNALGEPVNALSYDPLKDVTFLEVELDMWYFGILKKGWEKFARQLQQEKMEIQKALAKQLSGLKVTEEIIDTAIANLSLDREKPTTWGNDELLKLATALRKKSKPMILACNKIDVPGAVDNFNRLQKEFQDYVVVACSAESELALKEAAKHKMISYVPGEKRFAVGDKKLNEKQEKALSFIQHTVLDKNGSTGVQSVLNTAVFDLLKYIAIFPGGVNNLEDKKGNVLPDCFLLASGSTPVDFAFRIHTDIGNKYVKALNVKTKLPLAKETMLQHRDVVEIKTSN